MKQRVSVITLGTSDLKSARAFYEAIGWRSRAGEDDDVVFFQTGGIVLSLWDRARLAEDSGVPLGSGYGGITLAHNVRSPAEVDAIVEQAEQAGATIARTPAETFWGGYSGVFLDLDGYPWEIAHNPHWALGGDGSVALPA
jgi:catechol 2,3-dioxygenase-like lactoylglutathione lyase family enzyme